MQGPSAREAGKGNNSTVACELWEAFVVHHRAMEGSVVRKEMVRPSGLALRSSDNHRLLVDSLHVGAGVRRSQERIGEERGGRWLWEQWQIWFYSE